MMPALMTMGVIVFYVNKEMGLGGSVVGSVPCVRRIAGLNPTVTVT